MSVRRLSLVPTLLASVSLSAVEQPNAPQSTGSSTGAQIGEAVGSGIEKALLEPALWCLRRIAL